MEMEETREYYMARISNADRWVPACGGTETPFRTRTGRRLLYCWNPAIGDHAYLDVDTDLILSSFEAHEALGIL